MTRYLSVKQVKELHHIALEHAGGSDGLRDEGSLESAVAQPMMAFGGEELYPTLQDKAAALGYSLVMNHPFVDGNKRVGFLAMDTFLRANGLRIGVATEEGERMILAVASGSASRRNLVEWLDQHVTKNDQ